MEIQQKRHLSDDVLADYFQNRLTNSQEQKLLEHIAQCDYCAGRFASALPESALLTPHPDLSRRILAAADSRKGPHCRQQREFYYYVTKVVLSMAMALFLLIGGPLLKAPSFLPGSDNTYTDTSPAGDGSAQNTPFYQEYLDRQRERNAERVKAQEQYEQKMQTRSEKKHRPEQPGLQETLSEQGQRMWQHIKNYWK